MTKVPALRLLMATSALALPLLCASAQAAPARSKGALLLAAAPRNAAKPAPKASTELPRFLTLDQVKRVQARQVKAGHAPLPLLQPMWEGNAIKVPMKNLLTGPAPDLGALVKTKTGLKKVDRKLFAQAFPRPVAPASPRNFRPVAKPATPKWVRYPLEFQLAGIGLGTRAVDKDRFNRIDRYGLFALHGNPTAVVRQVDKGLFVRGAQEGGGAAAGGGGGEGGPGGTGTVALGNLTMFQAPPEATTLFPRTEPSGGLPDWSLAVTVQLDNNHVQWLYKRDGYAMGFVVDRLGFVDAIIVAGLTSPISKTQLEDPVHTVKLGDDLRKVMFRYGYPDDIVPLASDPSAAARPDTGAQRGTGGAGGGAGGGGGAGAGGGGGSVGTNSLFTGPGTAVTSQSTEIVNAAYRTYDLRYEQSYNVVFTVRDNRVVRIYIFGDPDFFNAERRNLLRTKY